MKDSSPISLYTLEDEIEHETERVHPTNVSEYTFHNQRTHDYSLTANQTVVPEPSLLVMMSLVCLGIARRIRNVSR